MHEQMPLCRGCAAEGAAESEQPFDMGRLGRYRSGPLQDHVVEAELEPLMRAEVPEYLGHGPLRIEDGEHVAHARLPVFGELVEAAESGAEGQFHDGSVKARAGAADSMGDGAARRHRAPNPLPCVGEAG